MVPSKTRVFLLLWASRPPWAPYWDRLAILGSPIVPYWCPLGLLLGIIGLPGAPHRALLTSLVSFMEPTETLVFLDVLSSWVPLGSPLGT